jgi:mannitol-1-phosphate 5-dehydrogenase
MMTEHTFVGFGFGPIQSGLFAKEAFQSGNFARIVVAEIDADLADAVRANKGSYYVNVARADGIDTIKIDNVEMFNPNIAVDRQILLEVLSEATEITTCLPSVDFYEAGAENSPASLIAEGLKNSEADATIVYTAENNNHAAEILEKAITEKIGSLSRKRVQFLNTVIGKMSRVVTDPAEIEKSGLAAIAPAIKRAFLVEEFNRILVSRTTIGGFRPGIEVFIEKDDLLPFEEAKLFGHNAIHALLGFIGAVKGATSMSELKDDEVVMEIARSAFLNECGAALITKNAYTADELFTATGLKDYAEDLLERITNPYLGDTVARACRDIVRKLSVNDRLFGTMNLALEYGIEPKNMAIGAMAGIAVLLRKAQEYNLPADLRFADWRQLDNDTIEKIIDWLWKDQSTTHTRQIIKYVQNAQENLKKLTTN